MESQWGSEHLLAGDADRERTIEALKTNFQAGRLTVDELSERIGQALNARTYGELNVVMTGLPALRPNPPVPMYPPMYYQPPKPTQRGAGVAAFVLGVLGFICGITAVPAIILGVVALAMNSERDDKGFAIAGIATGAMWLAIFGLWILT
ncbi:DUF1707 and DUF4190 domain-containing protein [Nocardia sp. 2]|uniref:DUF1707 and DUF4190 domain-containing protein n=1 Tax=Nocardia acididurans TaxID=2802282 RepID=A0ABS1LY24_9NOCA|nr:DUF1707 and DUF4190 domain-containing protein [Nocardia acididurans]MBL1073287.1 DUF1707 and DUF4190 domain-containing protein [Nocardia acididurans]